jgi:hypothetical protein
MSQAVNKTDPQSNTPPPSMDDYNYPDLGMGDGGDPTTGGTDFGNGQSSFDGQAPTRAQVLKLFENAKGRPDEKKVDQVLREVLNDLLAGDQEKAAEDFANVPQDVINPPADTQTTTGDDNGTQPSSVKDLPGYGKTEIYDDLKVKDYSFTPSFTGKVKTHKVFSNGGKVVINGTTSQDTAEVSKNPDGTYLVKIHKEGQTDDKNTETFIVDGPPASLVINVVSKNIIHSQLPLDDSVVQLGTGSESNNVSWPGAAAIAANIPPGDGSAEAQELLKRVDIAMSGNDASKWKDVTDYLSGLWPSQNQNHNPSIIGGPALRKFLTALYKTVGSKDDKMKALLSKLDPGFRREMVRCLDQFATGTNIYRASFDGHQDPTPDTYYGQDAKNEGDQWGNAAARDVVAAAPEQPIGGNSSDNGE